MSVAGLPPPAPTLAGPAGSGDVVAGVAARFSARPGDAGGLAAVLREGAEFGHAVVARGRGTKLDWGAPPERVDLLVDLSGLDRVLEYNPGDLVVRVEAGLVLAELQQLLAASGQRLAIDEAVAGSTIGGIVSTGLSGPLRYAYGGVRDLLIGLTVVRGDGVVARSGGKVVKNVAGYDLGKLFVGAFGTLGVVAEATFRLHPQPRASAWLTATRPGPDELCRLVAAVAASPLAPAAVECDRPGRAAPFTLTVLIEGGAASVAERAGRLAARHGFTVAEEPPGWWGAVPGPTTLKWSAEFASSAAVLQAIDAHGRATGCDPVLRGSVGLGLGYLALDAATEPERAASFVEALRKVCLDHGGSLVVVSAPAAWGGRIDPWGPVPTLALMRRVKAGLDPRRAMAPGRFVGGI